MKLGLQLHPERGVDALIDEACAADEQGFDSIWFYDHLLNWNGPQGPDGPLEAFTTLSVLGGKTSRVRLAWAVLNLTFHRPAVLAKMLATLDQLTHGRVICSVGSGWFLDEYRAYDLPLIEDHDERAVYAREVLHLLKELWTHPAPAQTTFEGKYVRVRDLAFNPAPFQQPHPPIWVGGDSEATLELVREFGDGWIMLKSGNPETLGKVLSDRRWPARPMTLTRNARIYVAPTHAEAVASARAGFEATQARSSTPGHERPGAASELEAFVQREIVGSPDECLARLREMESWGISYLKVNFDTLELQQRTAELLLPRL